MRQTGSGTMAGGDGTDRRLRGHGDRLVIYRAGLARMREARAGGAAPATAAWQAGEALAREFRLDVRERALLVSSLFAVISQASAPGRKRDIDNETGK